jgi:RNA polymerase sigma-70 factor (ECF subfamily)
VTGAKHTQTFGAEAGADESVHEELAGFDLDSAYRAHAADVSRFIRQLSRRDDVSDLLHESFVVAQRRRADFRGDASVRTWLFAIAVRVVAGFRRKQKLRRLFFMEPGHSDEAPEAVDPATPYSVVTSRRATEAVNRVLERLSERDRTLIISFELEGLSAAEIQVILGLSANAVWVGLHRARERFRKVFVELYGAKE